MIKRAYIILGLSIAISATLIICSIYRIPGSTPELSYRVVKIDQNWAYEILVRDSIFIHQEYMPGLQGRHFFKTEESARLVAEYIINKIETGKGATVSSFEASKLQTETSEIE